MPSGVTQMDPTLLRVLMRRLSELETEAHAVSETVLDYLPDAGPGIAQATVAELATGLTTAFDTLAGSVALTRRIAAAGQRGAIDLTAVRDLDPAAHAG